MSWGETLSRASPKMVGQNYYAMFVYRSNIDFGITINEFVTCHYAVLR
jgi:hypothetical protein